MYIDRSLAVLCNEIVELSQTISSGLLAGWYGDFLLLEIRRQECNDPNVAASVQWDCDLPREWWSYDVSKMILILLEFTDKETYKSN